MCCVCCVYSGVYLHQPTHHSISYVDDIDATFAVLIGSVGSLVPDNVVDVERAAMLARAQVSVSARGHVLLCARLCASCDRVCDRVCAGARERAVDTRRAALR
jgi:hypothetical protein